MPTGDIPAPASPAAPAAASRTDRLNTRGAAVVGLAVMCSRVLGLAREQIFAALFGGGRVMDAFTIAFRIPNLLRDLFAEGALSTAFVTIFSRTVALEDDAVGLAARQQGRDARGGHPERDHRARHPLRTVAGGGCWRRDSIRKRPRSPSRSRASCIRSSCWCRWRRWSWACSTRATSSACRRWPRASSISARSSPACSSACGSTRISARARSSGWPSAR